MYDLGMMNTDENWNAYIINADLVNVQLNKWMNIINLLFNN